MNEKITKRTVIRYILFQIPGLGVLVLVMLMIRSRINIPAVVFYGIISAWIAKDIILFCYTWKAYIPKKDDIMIGKKGIALERIIDKGYITVNGEQWKAFNSVESPIEKGQEILILERKGLTLFVKPSGSGNAE